MTADLTKLKPCPFCGGSDDLRVSGLSVGYADGPEFAATCSGCGARGPIMTIRSEAAAAWNRRLAEEKEVAP